MTVLLLADRTYVMVELMVRVVVCLSFCPSVTEGNLFYANN